MAKNGDILWPLIGLSFALHLIIFGVIVSQAGSGPIIAPDRIISAKLVRLGLKRDPNLLPRKMEEVLSKPIAIAQENTAPILKPETVKKEIMAESAKKVEVAPKNKASDAVKKESAQSRLDKLIKSKKFEGDEKGSLLGTELSGSLVQGYAEEVAKVVRDSFELPSILSDAERRSLEVVVRLRINSQGRLVIAQVMDSSNNRLFDDAVLNGVKSVLNFGSPPLSLRKNIAKEGLLIRFCPLSCEKKR